MMSVMGLSPFKESLLPFGNLTRSAAEHLKEGGRFRLSTQASEDEGVVMGHTCTVGNGVEHPLRKESK